MPVAQRSTGSSTSTVQAKGSRPRSVPSVSAGDGDGERKARPRTLEDLFGAGDNGNLLQGRFNTEAVYHWFQQRHKKGAAGLINAEGVAEVEDDKGRVHSWKVPYGVRYALRQPLIHAQIVTRYPWYVTWMSPKTGKRMKKYFSSLPSAIMFITERAQHVDSHASVVARHGIDIPPKLRGRLPKPWKWCPCCMTARKFYRTEDTFYGTIKVWDEKKGHYIWKERKLALMRCKVCGVSNRDHKFRRSNQPWELRKFKRGVTRARRRK